MIGGAGWTGRGLVLNWLGMPRVWARFLIVGVFFLAALRVAQVWDQLPPTMASHFGASGAANGFMGRFGFFLFYALINGFVVALLLGVSLLIGKLPTHRINLPARDHWLSSANRTETLARIGAAFDWYALATTTFSFGVLELVLRANLERRGLANGPFFAMLAGYMLFNLGWTVWLLLSFRQPEGQ